VDGDLIYSAGQFGPAFGYLGGLAHRLADRDYFGPLSTDAPARIEVFRRGDMWTAAVWATVEDQGAEVLVDLPVAADGAATHYDALGNVLAPLEVRDGVVQVAAAAEPAFVESRGGPMLQRVAAEAARRRADAFVGDERFAEALPEAVLQLVAPYAEGTMEDGEGRERFLGLLRLFVYLERERAEGALPVDAAIPAAGALADLARYLCVLEEARGEPFVELLPKTLANCRDFQLQYVATAGEANESPLDRGAWLIGEVRRLCDQAVRLDEMGRSIEAAAVARLAEWRARSLEYAAPID
jgi:hypothetical protein